MSKTCFMSMRFCECNMKILCSHLMLVYVPWREKKPKILSLSLSHNLVVISLLQALYQQSTIVSSTTCTFFWILSRKNREIRNSIIKRDIHARCIITRFTITEEEYYRNCEFNCKPVSHSQIVEIPQNFNKFLRNNDEEFLAATKKINKNEI